MDDHDDLKPTFINLYLDSSDGNSLHSQTHCIYAECQVGVRHVQVAYMVLCAAAMGALRSSAGVALLTMTDVSQRNNSYVQVLLVIKLSLLVNLVYSLKF